MTNQMNLLPDEPGKQPKKRGPYKKRVAPAALERAMAKLELKTAMLSGLFETTRKGPEQRFNAENSEKSAFLDKNNPSRLQLKEVCGVYDHEDEETKEVFPKAIFLRLKAPVLLGVKAETVLLALLHILNKQSMVPLVKPSASDETSDSQMLIDEAEGDAKGQPKGEIKTLTSEVLRTAGMGDGKQDYLLLDTFLEQMSEMRVFYENKITGWKGSDSFLRYRRHKDGRLEVWLNWRLTGAIFKEYKFADIDLNERHILKGDNTKTLHRWLSGYMWEGKTRDLKYSTLAGHTWSEKTTEAGQQKREQRVRSELLQRINELDRWSVEFLKDTARITRHKKAKGQLQA